MLTRCNCVVIRQNHLQVCVVRGGGWRLCLKMSSSGFQIFLILTTHHSNNCSITWGNSSVVICSLRCVGCGKRHDTYTNRHASEQASLLLLKL